jgi:hypothetical protein
LNRFRALKKQIISQKPEARSISPTILQMPKLSKGIKSDFLVLPLRFRCLQNGTTTNLIVCFKKY